MVFVMSSFVFVDDVFVSYVVDYWYSGGEGGLGFFQVFGVDGFYDVFDVGVYYGVQVGVVVVMFFSLFGVFFGGRCVGYC